MKKKIVAISALSVLAAGAVAIGVQQRHTPADATSADLERDLSMANSVQSTRAGVVSAIEQTGTGAPSGGSKGVRAPVVTHKPALSAAPSKHIAEVAAAPTNETPLPAEAPPTVTLPPEAVATTTEATTKAAAPDPAGAPVSAMVGGPSSGGIGEGDRGLDSRGTGRPGVETDIHMPTGSRPLLPPTTIAGVINEVVNNSVVLRGGDPGIDNCKKPGPSGRSPVTGAAAGISTAIVSGGAMPRGSLPGGNRAPARRW